MAVSRPSRRRRVAAATDFPGSHASLMHATDGRNYLDRYCEYLEQAIRATLESGA